MPNVSVFDMNGKKVSDLALAESVFGIEPNSYAMHLCVVNYLANQRQGTQSTRTRSEVSGGGKKPWKQKGTGRARQGSIRATQWVGGGVPFGPTPRSHKRRLNNKEVKLAMRGVLSGKVRDNELVVVDNYGFDKPCTKQAVALLKALGLEGKRVTLVVADDDIYTYLSFRNVETVRVLGVSEVTTHALIDNAALVLNTECAKKLEEVLA